ncbi:MAG: hypothetical protein KJI69_05425 [Patescibacteria group bacterium]|nr:hypothetical protein [Patescibacteria group bacterium]
MAKKKKVSGTRLAMFAVGMVIGLGLIIFDQFDTIQGFVSGTETPSLAFIDVPIDPTTGGILGTIIFGAPDEFGERSGAVLTPSGLGSCVQDIDPSLGRDYEWKFGRQLIGDPNVAPIWHGYNGANCAIGYMEWDLRDIPNDFRATSVRFQLELTEVPSTPRRCGIIVLDQTLDQIGEMNLGQRRIDIEFSGLETSTPNPLGSNFPNIPAPTIADPDDFWFTGLNVNFGTGGDWCKTVGVKSFTVGRQISDQASGTVGGGSLDPQFGVDAFNKALTDGQDRFTMIVVPIDGFGSGTWTVNYDYWKTQGSLKVEGSSPPLRCSAGFDLQGFRCVAITCPDGQTVNLTNNMCEPITCNQGQELQGNICVAIQCEIGEILVPPPLDSGINEFSCIPLNCPTDEQIVGDSCEPLVCDVGFDAINNECTLKTCGIGLELIGDECQAIQCNTPNTILIGSDCVQTICRTNQLLVDGQCINITDLSFETCSELIPFSDGVLEITDCQTADPTTPIICLDGFTPVGNTCVQLPENCPIGTVAQENICVQVLPDLMISQAPELGTLTIIGIVIFGGSFFGLVGSRRV